MAELESFDKLNNIELPKTYFSAMSISEKQKAERVRFATQLAEALIDAFSVIAVMYVSGYVTEEIVKANIDKAYREVVGNYAIVDKYVADTINVCVQSVASTTLKSLKSNDSEEVDKIYALSHKRAFLVSEIDANTFLNYVDYSDAKYEGKTKKQWLTMQDNKVRDTHSEVDSKIVPIDELYIVGGSLMRFPHDMKYGADAKEIIGCRCGVEYFD